MYLNVAVLYISTCRLHCFMLENIFQIVSFFGLYSNVQFVLVAMKTFSVNIIYEYFRIILN